VESEPGLGAEFRLYLPLIPEPVPTQLSKPAPKPIAPAKSIRILVVDDEYFMRDLSSTIFTSMGHTVTACKDGFEALDAYRDDWRSYDLVVLDMVMPGMNGKELFRKLKEINPGVIAVLASGYSTDADARDLLEGGVRAFIPKPFGKPELAALIEELFSDSRSGAPAA
jgi:CheY-like chemotaxis protein